MVYFFPSFYLFETIFELNCKKKKKIIVFINLKRLLEFCLTIFPLQVKIEFTAGKYKKLIAVEEVAVDNCTRCKGFILEQCAQQSTCKQCDGVVDIPRFFEEEVCFNYSIVYSLYIIPLLKFPDMSTN